MPIYEFKCKKCGNVFESLCFASDREDDISCPSCGGKETERLLSAFSSCSSSAGHSISSSVGSTSCSPRGGFS